MEKLKHSTSYNLSSSLFATIKRAAFILPFFLVCFLTTVNAQQWPIIGSEQDLASATSNYTAIAVATEGEEGTLTVPYVIYTESNIAKVKKYINGVWLQVGGNVSSGNATYTRIYVDGNNKVYVSYVDAANSNKLAVKILDSSDSTWQPLNRDANNLYVSNGSVSTGVSNFSSSARSSLAFDSTNRPYILFGEGTNLNPTVKRYNGTAWETVGSGPVSSDIGVSVSMAIDSTTNAPYLAYAKLGTTTSTTGSLTVYRFTNTGWENIAVPNPIPGGSSTAGNPTGVRHTNIAFTSNWDPVISYFNANNSNRTTIIYYNKAAGTWTYYGTLSGRDITYNSLYRDNGGNVYSSFIDIISSSSGKTVSRVFKLRPGATSWVELKAPDAEGIDNPTSNLSVASGEDTSRPYVVYTKTNSSSVVTPIVRRFSSAAPPPPPPPAPDSVVTTPKQMEKLDRGLIAVRTSATEVYVSWRLFGTDSSNIAFNLYRDGVLVNLSPIINSTNYVDNSTINSTYALKPVINGVEHAATKPASIWGQNHLNIALQPPAPGITPDNVAYTYSPNDASVGDVDGDGEYEIILKWDPSNSKDNSQSGYTGNVYLDAYKLNGTRLWRIDLGRNIRAGAHYTQFIVYDLDGDGKAEVACKTADGTIDGVGTVIGSATADYRNTSGYILSGPEFLTVFNGLTGAAMATQNYLPARGTVSSWGDSYGNRVDRFIAAVAYLDGARPSLIMGRGYYTRLVRAAWDYRNGQLTSRWVFDSNTPGNSSWAGQGNHQMTIGDVDGDGKDEIFNGSSGINDNGKGLWANGMGHGDALHMTDIDPDRPGLEMWQPYEDPASNGMIGAALVDAKTGDRIFTVPLTAADDVGRALSANIDPRYKGNESWASRGNLYTAKGVQIGTSKPSMNFAIWWDADSTRELLDGNTITKWNYLTNSASAIMTATGSSSNNSTKSTPALSADILGDWREEVIFRSSDNLSLRIYTTTALAQNRFYTLMHDPQYRTAIAWQNSAYNQPPHPGFYLGEGMGALQAPNIFIAGEQQLLPVKLVSFNAKANGRGVNLNWKTANEINNETFTIERSKDGRKFYAIYNTKGVGSSSIEHSYAAVDENPFVGLNYYRLKQTDVDGKSSYSPVRTVNFEDVAGKLSISPNPVTNSVRLNFNSSSPALKLVLTTSDGRIIMKANGSLNLLNNQLNNKVQSLNSGVYIVQLWDGDKMFTDKMIKRK